MENSTSLKILFVCLGNICRSPLAEAIASDYAKERSYDLVVDSCGTGDWHIGNPPCDDSIKIAKIKGLDISNYKARQVTKDDFKNFDFIIALDSKNVASLKALGCKNAVKLGEFGFEGEDVPDPYFFNEFEGFYKVFDMIETCTKNLLDEKFKSLNK